MNNRSDTAIEELLGYRWYLSIENLRGHKGHHMTQSVHFSTILTLNLSCKHDVPQHLLCFVPIETVTIDK